MNIQSIPIRFGATAYFKETDLKRKLYGKDSLEDKLAAKMGPVYIRRIPGTDYLEVSNDRLTASGFQECMKRHEISGYVAHGTFDSNVTQALCHQFQAVDRLADCSIGSTQRIQAVQIADTLKKLILSNADKYMALK